MSAHLTEGKDFYYDLSGAMVLTREFLIARGKCCESGCRHCPYGFNPDAVPTPSGVSVKLSTQE